MDPCAMNAGERFDDWETPAWLFDRLDAEFHFTLDAAASPQTAKCARYYTPHEDGLVQSWSGEIVWINPPYSWIGAWVDKALHEARRGATVILLTFARTDTQWFHRAALYAEIRFVVARVAFLRDGFQAKSCAAVPSIVLVFRPPCTTRIQTTIGPQVADPAPTLFS